MHTSYGKIDIVRRHHGDCEPHQSKPPDYKVSSSSTPLCPLGTYTKTHKLTHFIVNTQLAAILARVQPPLSCKEPLLLAHNTADRKPP